MAVEFPTSAPPIPGTPSSIPGTPRSVPSYGEIHAPTSLRLRSMDGRFTKNGMGWEWRNLTKLMNMPENFGGELLEKTEKHLEHLADEIERYAKENAPWQDGTGDARRGLHAIYRRGKDVFEIDLGHSVSYGFYLENHNGGMYAIIQPTLRAFAPKMAQITAEQGRTSESLPGGFE
jgi:hypothetical protein